VSGGPLIVSGDRQVTRAAMMARVRRAASGFAAQGVGPGDCVALLLRNDIAFLEASLAATMLGGYAVPINWHWKADEVAYLLRDCDARIAVVHEDLVPLLADAPEGLKTLVVHTPPEVAAAYHLQPPGDRAPGEDWDSWLSGLPEWSGAPQPPRESMIYTSGTTGRPKGVRRQSPTPEQIAGTARNRAQIYGLKPGIRALVPGPLYHSAPNGFGLRAAPIAELLVLMPRFDPEAMLALIEQHRIDTMFVVPTMMVRLLRLPEQVRQESPRVPAKPGLLRRRGLRAAQLRQVPSQPLERPRRRVPRRPSRHRSSRARCRPRRSRLLGRGSTRSRRLPATGSRCRPCRSTLRAAARRPPHGRRRSSASG
jgi:long-chain acyl-CoA synthetase